jgi:broad specificity phosphatase PhoE
MRRRLFFITHPNVAIDPAVPVPQWRLSELGVARMRAGLKQPWIGGITAVHCSKERKAIDGAEILAAHLQLDHRQHEALGENDRSATGFLAPQEFETVADAFFANPDGSVRGWETARAAQSRIVQAVRTIVATDDTSGDIAIVSHGAVGTLLFCHLAGEPISRTRDQPANGGGNYFGASLGTMRPQHWWRRLDDVP